MLLNKLCLWTRKIIFCAPSWIGADDNANTVINLQNLRQWHAVLSHERHWLASEWPSPHHTYHLFINPKPSPSAPPPATALNIASNISHTPPDLWTTTSASIYHCVRFVTIQPLSYMSKGDIIRKSLPPSLWTQAKAGTWWHSETGTSRSNILSDFDWIILSYCNLIQHVQEESPPSWCSLQISPNLYFMWLIMRVWLVGVVWVDNQVCVCFVPQALVVW